MDKHIDGFRGYLGFYFGKNTKLYMSTAGKVFCSLVLLLGFGGTVFGILYFIQSVILK